jgi:hypothetical protein
MKYVDIYVTISYIVSRVCVALFSVRGSLLFTSSCISPHYYNITCTETSSDTYLEARNTHETQYRNSNIVTNIFYYFNILILDLFNYLTVAIQHLCFNLLIYTYFNIDKYWLAIYSLAMFIS